MTSAAFASLSAPVLEDTMELSSSPAGNQFDGDIDIDLGDYHNLTDDEHMLDDVGPTRPATATDEMMDDDDDTTLPAVNEEVMQDGPESFAPEIADEDLIDYDDQDYPDPPVNETAQAEALNTLSVPAEAPAIEEHVEEQVVFDFEAPPEEAGTSVNDGALAEPASQAEVAVDSKSAEAQPETVNVEQDTTAATQVTEGSPEGSVEVSAAADSHESVQTDEEAAQDENVASKPLPQLPGSLDTNIGHVSDGPATPTDTGLHPMTLKFANHEMPLFKSRAQPNGLLKDDNLASVSLADLIHNCKQRLSTKLGEGSVPEGQDLVLNFDRMGMMLFEGSRSASSISLNDVVDVYCTLHQNDGVDVPPLLLSLNPQPSSTMFDAFKTAAAKGTGMSHFLTTSTDQEHFAQHEEAEQAIYDETDYAENGHEGVEQHDTYDQTDETGNYEFDLGDEQDENQEQYEEYDQGEEREYEGAENTQESHEDNSAFQQYPGPEDDLSQYDDEDYQEEASAAEQHQDEAAEHGESNEAVQPKSTASSATIRGEPANDNTDAYTGDGEEEFLAFIADDGDADAQDGSPNIPEADQQTTAKTSTVPDTQDEAHSEDVLNDDYKDAENGDNVIANLEEDYDQSGEDLLEFIEDEDEDGVQTDSLGQTQEEFDQNEDTEQFHTALDLIDGTNESYDNTAGDTGDAPNGEEYPAEDEIGYDDEDGENDYDTTGAEADNSNSPLGKRSFEELVDEDDFGLDEPDLKKSRSG